MAVRRVYIYFDKPLQPRALVAVDWFVRVYSRERILSNGIARVDRVQFDTGPGPISVGPDICNYYGVIAKLRDEDGLEIAPWISFPITRVPP